MQPAACSSSDPPPAGAGRVALFAATKHMQTGACNKHTKDIIAKTCKQLCTDHRNSIGDSPASSINTTKLAAAFAMSQAKATAKPIAAATTTHHRYYRGRPGSSSNIA